MTRREKVLSKLHSLTEKEEEEGIKDLVKFISARLRVGSKYDRTKSGAFSINNLGENAVIYFRDITIEALYKPDGWDWEFEKRSFSEQLIRIANSLISKEVDKYKRKVTKDEIPKFEDSDIGDILNKIDQKEDSGEERALVEKFEKIAIEITKDNDNLNYFTILFFENPDLKWIAKEMDKSIEDIYKLKRKLRRRIESRKGELNKDEYEG